MADQASSSITIKAPADAVLAVIRDLEAYPTWANGISKVVIDSSGELGPATATFTLSQSGLSDTYSLRYTWNPTGVSWSLVAPSTILKSQEGTYTLAEKDGATRVDYLLVLDLKIPMIGLMKRKFEKRIIEGALNDLKKRVESL